jgi:tRNA modification GTPase
VVLAGYPNAGKSSLFNYLLNRERAIVSEVPGTTRDSLEAFLDIDGIPIKLVDTAGIRQSSDKIEAMGIARSLEELKSADTVIWLTEQGQRIDLELLSEFEIDTGKILYAQSKSDNRTTGATGSNMDEIKISTETGAGVDTLIARLKQLLISEDAPDNVITTVRQKDLLEKSTSHISATIRIIENNPEHFELITEELAYAVEYLDEFLGLSRRTDVLDTVFKNFCVGK